MLCPGQQLKDPCVPPHCLLLQGQGGARGVERGEEGKLGTRTIELGRFEGQQQKKTKKKTP